MISYKKIVLVLILCFTFITLFGDTSNTIVQLLDPDNDRLIVKQCYYMNQIQDDVYFLLNNYQNPERSIGDVASAFTDEQKMKKWYQEYPFIEIPEGLTVYAVIFKMFRGSILGNDMSNTYPLFGINQPPVKITEVDFDFSDLAGSFYPSESRHVGILTDASDDGDYGFRSVDITQAYLASRDHYQEESFKLMIHFDTESDLDDRSDNIHFSTSTSNILCGNDHAPRLEFYFIPTPNSDNELEQAQFNVYCYPNPTKSDLSLNAKSGQYIQNVNIYNIKGQLVYSKNKIDSKSSNVDIKLPSTLSSGVYLVKSRLTDGKAYKDITKKIVIK